MLQLFSFYLTVAVAKENHCFSTASDQQRTLYMAEWSKAWFQRLNSIGSIQGSAMRRSAEDWIAFQDAEIKKATSKLTVKVLAQKLSSEFPKHADSLPEKIPVEVVECWKASAAEGSEGESFEAKLSSSGLKKEVLATSLVMLQIMNAKEKEEEHCRRFQDQVRDALSVCGHAGGVDDDVGSGINVGSVQDLEIIPVPQVVDNNNWKAHRAAALATSFLMKAYLDSDVIAELEGQKVAFSNNGLQHIEIIKKKLCVRQVSDAYDKDEMNSRLSSLRLVFSCRLVVSPCGQPVSFKSKMSITSQFFKNLGFDAYLVPVSNQQAADVAVKSPLFCPAWLVKPKKTGGNMTFAHLAVKIQVPKLPDSETNCIGVDSDVIDLVVPALEFETSGEVEETMTKVKLSDQRIMVGHDLCRPFSTLEELEGDVKMKQKEDRSAAKKRRSEKLDGEWEDDNHDRDDAMAIDKDQQLVDLPMAFIRHILR